MNDKRCAFYIKKIIKNETSCLFLLLLLVFLPFLFVQSVSAQQNSIDNTLNPSLKLLGAGAIWAAGQGDSVLYVNWKDNWVNHYSSDGATWNWYAQSTMDEWKASVLQTLEEYDFEVTCLGDMPKTLSGYDLVIIEASYAVEPSYASIVKEYVSNGGGVVIMCGVPCYFSVYCRDFWPYRLGGTDLTSIERWFGASNFWNTGGSATITVNNPFSTDLSSGDVIFSCSSSSCVYIHSLEDDSNVIAQWNSDYVSALPFYSTEKIFAFTHEYGKGRVYYQAHIEVSTDADINSGSSEIDPKLDLQPATGLAQTTIKGSGFEPNSEITVTWNGTILYTVPDPVHTDNYGKFTAIISALNQTNGQYQILAMDEMENQATATFNVIPEFPSWIILLLFLIATVLITVSKNKLTKLTNCRR